MELVLSEPNDLLQGEYIADAAHYVFSLEGMMFQRKYYRAHNYDDLANKVDANILQWWAHILLATNQLDTPERTNFAFAHQRTVFPTGSATLIDYYWRRGCGQSHTGTGLANLGERIAIRQAPFNGKLFADFFIGELRADVGRLLVSYRTMGYTGIARLIKRGSRGLFHWIRLDNGGYISLLENDIGVDEPRYVAIRHSKGSNLVQFPEGNVGRFSREGRATLDIASGHITALDSTYGSFSTTFDPKTIALHVTATPNGVTIQGRWA
jgi:hypothetical protein